MRPRVSYSLSAKNAVLPLNTRITKFRRGNSNKLSFLAFAPDSLSLSLVPFQNNAGLGGSSRKVGLSAPRFSSVRCFLRVPGSFPQHAGFRACRRDGRFLKQEGGFVFEGLASSSRFGSASDDGGSFLRRPPLTRRLPRSNCFDSLPFPDVPGCFFLPLVFLAPRELLTSTFCSFQPALVEGSATPEDFSVR